MTFLSCGSFRYNEDIGGCAVDIFQGLPMAKRSSMERLFRNCTEKVKTYMFVMDVAAGQTFIQAGEARKYLFMDGRRRERNACTKGLTVSIWEGESKCMLARR